MPELLDYAELNAEQKKAVLYDQGHVLVLAGAGTGKTRTIIARAAHLIQKGVRSDRILMLAFTRRAAMEMTHRLTGLLGGQPSNIMAGTFHHFCLYSMRRLAHLFDLEGATVIDRDDQIQLMRLIRPQFRTKGEVFPKAAELVNLVSYARNTVQPMADYLERHTEYDDDICARLCQAAKVYDKRKRRSGYLDYDDILFIFAKKVNENPEVHKRLRAAYDHILVDEMQDTNPLQWLALDALRDPAQLFCVGDDAQSIFAFRGADFRNVHAFTQRVPGAVILRLEKNYRSTQGILDLSNWLLANSPVAYNKQLRAARRAVSRPRLINFDSEFEEARWIADDLIERHETGAAWNDHMIITRTGYGARALEAAMVEKQIPYRFVGGVSLLQAAHVKDLLCLVRAAGSHHDELAWARYLTLWPRIGDATAAKVIVKMRACLVPNEALKVVTDTLKGRSNIVEGIRRIRASWEQPSETIAQAARFLSPLLKTRYERWERRKRDFKLLEQLAERHRSVLAFIETYTLDPVSTSETERLNQEDIVTLTTAHSAKGAESRACYLIRVEPGMYPHVRSIGALDEEEEERRILYVAMTRAKDELIITRTFRRFGPIRMHYSAAKTNDATADAYFLQQIPEKLLDQEAVHPDFSGFDDYEAIAPWRKKGSDDWL